MLTGDGLIRIWEIVAGQSEDSLEGGSIYVTDGDLTETAEIASVVVATQDGGATITVSAVFGEEAANFEWMQRRVLTRDGLIIDVDSEDGGRKVRGAVWTAEVEMELSAPQ